MTQEDKELLLKDLCARLPYGVIVRHADCIVDGEGNETGNFHYTKGYLYDVCREDDMTTTIIESGGENEGYDHICFLERTIPYLRPMSSMTEEENEEYTKINLYGFHWNFIDWCNSKHLDYRGLIEKGLAIEVTKDNNPY